MAKSKINAEISLKTTGTGNVVADVKKVTDEVKKSSGFIGGMKNLMKDFNAEVMKSKNPLKQLDGVLNVIDARMEKLTKYYNKARLGAKFVGNETKKFATASVGGVSMLAGGTIAAVKGVISLVDGVATKGDALAKFGRNVGMSAGQLQQWQYAAQRGGMSAEGMNSALQKFSVNVSKAANGEKKQMQMFNAMGIRLKDNKGHLKSTSTLMMEVANAYNKIGNAQDKMSITEDLFGKSNSGILNVFEGGSSSVQELLDRRAKIGGLFSPEDSKNAEAFKDVLLDVNEIVEGIKTEFVIKMLPSMNEGLNNFLDIWDKHGGKIMEKTKIAADVVGSAFIGLVDLAGQWCNVIDQSDLLFSMTGDDIKYVLNSVFEDFKALVRWWQDVPIIGDIIGFAKDVLTSGAKKDVAPAQASNPIASAATQRMVENKTSTSKVMIDVSGNAPFKADVDEAFKKDPNVDASFGYTFAY